MSDAPETFTAKDGSLRRPMPTGLQERFLRGSWKRRHEPPTPTTWGFFEPRKQVRDDIAELRARRNWNAGL